MNKFALFCRKAAPMALACLSAVGTVATAVLAAKETPQALMTLYRAEGDAEGELTIVQKAKVLAPQYIPAAIVCAATLLCSFGAVALSRKQQAQLASAYALLSEGYREYREKTKAVFGPDADDQIRKAILQERLNGNETVYPEVFADPSGDEKWMFYEEHYPQFFERSREEVLLAEYHLNRNLALGKDVTLNEFLSFLGLDSVSGGEDLGWMVCDDFTWLDFSNRKLTMDNGMECYAIEPMFPPQPWVYYDNL